MLLIRASLHSLECPCFAMAKKTYGIIYGLIAFLVMGESYSDLLIPLSPTIAIHTVVILRQFFETLGVVKY